MHDCSGLGPRSSGAPGRWAKELVARRLGRQHSPGTRLLRSASQPL